MIIGRTLLPIRAELRNNKPEELFSNIKNVDLKIKHNLTLDRVIFRLAKRVLV